MEYKVGDRVRIKSLDWYNENKDSLGNIDAAFFDEQRARFCGSIQTIASEGYTLGSGVTIYAIEGAYEFIGEESIEGLVEGGTKNNNDMEEKETLLGWVKENDSLRLVPHKDYEIKHDGDNFYLVKKKKEYPKTYEECCKVLEIDTLGHNVDGYKWEMLATFQNLLICRDAYWKIAGEEMGLGKPWEPDWTNEEWPDMAYISYDGKSIDKENGFPCCNMILIFPAEEMRDAFYENFKELIESCKELL